MTPFAIIASQRSGTTFLRRSLNNHPDIVCHGEPFGPGGLGILEAPVRRGAMPSKEERNANPIAFLDRLMSFHTSGLAGFKLLLAHSPPVLNEIASRGYRLIVLKRDNALARYSSIQILVALQQSGERFDRPANQGPSAIKATFDSASFERYVDSDSARWEATTEVLERHAPPFLNLEYGELAWGDGRERALDFLGAERRPLTAGIEKLNSTDVVSRFANPDVVREYLNSHGLTRWEREEPPGDGKHSPSSRMHTAGEAGGDHLATFDGRS
jgi:hypothetical protein